MTIDSTDEFSVCAVLLLFAVKAFPSRLFVLVIDECEWGCSGKMSGKEGAADNDTFVNDVELCSQTTFNNHIRMSPIAAACLFTLFLSPFCVQMPTTL